MKYTLEEWQNLRKNPSTFFVQCSREDGSDGWQPFPIGMSYRFDDVKDEIDRCQLGSHEKLVLCSINDYTDNARRGGASLNRRSILNTLAGHGIYNQSFSNNDFFYSLPSYKFIISPEGNGIDCHRHYEALMAGCIPIVEKNSLVMEKYKDCPILYTENYSEITEDYLNYVVEEMSSTIYDFSSLFLSTYSELDQKSAKDSGNYWMTRLNKGVWYQ